jgi:RND family efflux transporter MFP subunit
MKKYIAVFLLLLAAGALGWQIYQKAFALPTDQARPGRQGRSAAVAVETKPVEKKNIRDVGAFTGTLVPRSQAVVAPKVAGRLEKLMVNIGDRVHRGDLIAVLDDDEFIQQVEQARAELEVAKANVEEAHSAMLTSRREYERARALREKKIASESDLDSATAQYSVQQAKHKVALAQVTQKEAALRAAKVRLSYTRIQASWDNGEAARIIGERFVDEGSMLSSNTPIVSILDIDNVTAVIHVNERHYTQVTPGRTAVISNDAYPEKTFTGRIVRRAPLLRETSREARIEIDVPNSDELLRPGMFVRVEVEFSRHENATVVPVSALANRDGRQGVFIVDSEAAKARFVPTKLGILSGGYAEVLDPSDLSGHVVTLGQHLLEDGAPVIIPGSGSSGGKIGGMEGKPVKASGKPGRG